MPMTNAAEYLERTAARVPDKIAFSDAFGSLTFGQLLTRARALGTVLAGLPGCKNAPVAVLTGRTVQSVAALQGALQSGNYYVPIDEQMPEARMRRILTQVHARAIVFSESSRPQAERLTDCAPLVCLEEAEKTAPDDAIPAWKQPLVMRSLPPARPERRRASSSPTAPFWTLPTG